MSHESLTIEEREARLRDYHARDAIIRNDWWDGEHNGVYERVCLLAAWSPEAAHSKCATSCPADAMPRWLARLTPEILERTTHGALVASTEAARKLLLLTCKNALKSARDARPWPDWAIAATAEGWKPPRGWKP